jgi:hypothetical protein
MFNHISWQGYWTMLALLSVGYYLFIYLLYFRSDFKLSFPSKKRSNLSDSFLSIQSEGGHESDTKISDDPDFRIPGKSTDEHFVYAMLDEVAAYFNEAKKEKVVKEELLYSLQRIVLKYPTIQDSTYKESINPVIISEAAHHCSVHITSEEMGRVWLGV